MYAWHAGCLSARAMKTRNLTVVLWMLALLTLLATTGCLDSPVPWN